MHEHKNEGSQRTMIWDVRNFYSNLDRVGEEGSRFSPSFFVLVIAASLFATGGILANSLPVIIASMCVAPFLGPSRAVCIGGVYKNWKTAAKGLMKQLLGLLAIGSTIAFVATLVFLHLTPETIVTPEALAETLPTLKYVYLAMLIAMSSGVAASFVLVARPRIVSEPQQEFSLFNYPRLFDVTIGVEIAISLIPPASVVGMGLALGRFDIFCHSLGLLLVNMWGLDIGGMLVLYLCGVGPKPLQLETEIRRISEKAINGIVKAGRILSGVTLHSYQKADVHVRFYAFETLDRSHQPLAKIVSREIERETGVSNKVRIIATPVRMYTS